MRFLIGCSGAVGFVAFVVGLLVSLFVRDAAWSDRLTMAVVPGFMTFVAVLILAGRDSAKHSASILAVRDALLGGDDTSDHDFLSMRLCDDAPLLLETRKAVSRFFDVPTGKISRDVHLIDDLHVDNLQPSFQLSVVQSVIASRQVESKPFQFSMAGLESIDDLAKAIGGVFDDFDRRDYLGYSRES